MILYNVTLNVENSILDDWMKWMREVHIPEVMETGLFTDHKIYRLFVDEGNETTTFSFQYFLRRVEDIDLYLARHAPELQQKHLERYGKKVVAFRTVMEEI